MTWEDKITLSNLLNNKRYKEAVNLMEANKDNIDAQSVDIFISGFCLVHVELLLPIIPILERYIAAKGISFQGKIRISLAIEQCKKLKEERYGKENENCTDYRMGKQKK